MSELDVLVLAPDFGCFCIEVKNYRFGSVRAYDDDEILTGSGVHRHPVKKAQNAANGLRNHLDERGITKRDKPFLYATAAFPQIHRVEMYDSFGNEYSQHFEGMLFAEDLGDPEKLSTRLLKAAQRRPLGQNFGHMTPRPHQVAAVVEILTRRGTRAYRPIPEDLRRKFAKNHEEFRAPVPPSPSRPLRADERRKALRIPGASRRGGIARVVLHGKPGTGKTTELLHIAQSHALAGRSTLVCCFNKVLAADLRARIASLPSFEGARENLLITHLWALPSPQHCEVDDEEPSVGLDRFDTVCVDEAQDVDQVHFDRLLELCPDAEWFLSDSPGQALYSGRSIFLESAVTIAKTNGTWEEMRFNRRSGIADRLVADGALTHSPDVSAVPSWVAQHPVKVIGEPVEAGQEALDLGMPAEPRGHLPEFVGLATRGFTGRVSEYERIIDDEVGRVRAGDDLDFAVVVFRKDFSEIKAVRRALENLGLPYVDQVEAGSRGRALERGAVRIVTVHSMRGVDAARVLLLGLEHLESITENQQALLNIALSRGRQGLCVVTRPVPAAPGTHRAFVEHLVATYSASIAAV